MCGVGGVACFLHSVVDARDGEVDLNVFIARVVEVAEG
jgi:hypothetical protein